MSKFSEEGYYITNENMLLMNILEEIEKEDDEESFNILKNVVAKKNGILYYPIKSAAGVGFDGLFPDIKKTDEGLSISDLVAYALDNEENIIGYTTLKKKKFRGIISKIGIISGNDIEGKVINNIPIYNKVPTNVIGILPIEDIDETTGEKEIKYIFVCSNNSVIDLIYKIVTVGTFAGILLYKLINFILKSIEMANI